MEMNFDLLNQPHPHPLFFIEEGKNDGESVLCSKCRQLLRPPAFSCSDSDCDFHIHQSCIDLPPQIHNRFHPQHPLFQTTNNYICNACWQMPSGPVYECGQCSFQIDIKCAIADTKDTGVRQTADNEFRHFRHPHPLTLTLQPEQNRGTNEIVCVVCELLIVSGSSYYFCSQSKCEAHFHKPCAELPREMLNPDFHEHPLFLLPNVSWTTTICNSCKNDCREFFYNCSVCNFNLHVACLQSFNHKHTFTKFRNKTEFVCRACGKKGDEFSWYCTICHLSVHKKCAELPSTLKTFGHRLHDLSLTFFRNGIDVVPNRVDCKICGEEIKTEYAGYGCYECNYFVHLDCAPKATMTMDDFDSSDDEEIEISGTEIQHFIHRHSLTLFPPEKIGKDRVCDGCMMRLSESSPSYGCNYKQCDFIAHKECLELPRKKRNFVHKHKLTLISIPNFVFQCKACRQHFHGFAYRCEKCRWTFDIRCASIKVPFEHPSHQHPLSLDRTKEDHKCEACGKGVKNKKAFRCVDCNFHLDAGCATLPLAVKYRIDEHPLSLTFVEEEEDEYCCDICEEERDPTLWFYSCRECRFGAHVECVVGEFPFVKSKMHKDHRHPLNLAMKGEEDGGRGWGCRVCSESCADNLAFECRVCKFNVHAVGKCGAVQGSRAFTNRCFYPRGIGLKQYSVENGWSRVQLESYGGEGGSQWEEKVFSTIRAFVIYHGQWVHGFQIQYEKNGVLVWSEKHGGDEYDGSKTEIVLDYPNEYLVSIGGYYSDLRKWGSELIVIRSLTLQTNTRTWGSYGEDEGTNFSFPVGNGMKFIGLHGRSGSFLDAIGPYAMKKH